MAYQQRRESLVLLAAATLVIWAVPTPAAPAADPGILSGSYEIVSMPTGKVLEVPEGPTSNGTLIQQNALSGYEQQQWHFIQTGDGFYEIQNALTGKVLDVIGGSRTGGTLVQQWDYLGATNQQWQLLLIDDVHYAITNRNSGLSLDVRDGSTTNGAAVQQWTYLGNPQQLWVMVPVLSYNLTNSLSSYVLDVQNGSDSNGALIYQSASNGYRQQQWQFVPVGGGYLAIMNRNSGKVLDVVGRSTNGGALIQQWDYLGGENQQWQLVSVDATNYKIVNRQSGYVLDDINYSTTAGTNIQQWPYEGTSNQQWLITPVTYYNLVNQNSTLVLDVVDGATADGTNIQQWVSNGYQQQQWQLVLVSNGHYALMNNLTSKVMDVTNSSSANGALIEQNDYLAAPTQQWEFTPVNGGYYEISNANSGKVLDMTGRSLYSGGLLQQWDYLGGANQNWQLVSVDAGASSGPQPTVTLDSPSAGASRLSGHAYNVDPNTTKVVVYALTNQWYVQPLISAPFANISADGSWTSSTNAWSSLVVLLVNPATYTPPATEITNPALDSGVLAYTIYPQGPVSLDFSGYTWGIKVSGNVSGDQFAPGSNFWSNNSSVVNVAADGLHLKITEIDGLWQCGEIYLTRSLGYGTYTVQVSSHLDQLDQNTVAAPLFIYVDPNQELDNEYSGAGGLIPSPYNAQFVAQPYTVPGNLVRYSQPSTAQFTTQMQWASDHVTFKAWNGWASAPSAGQLIYQWTYTGDYIPPSGQERVHINLWLLNGQPPVNGRGDEMVVNSFAFQPAQAGAARTRE